MLPELREQDRSKFLPVPREFREEVEYATRSRLMGKLALLGHEARGSLWESEGLRIVGREQFRAKAFEGAGTTFEGLRSINPIDQEANLLLGTITSGSAICRSLKSRFAGSPVIRTPHRKIAPRPSRCLAGTSRRNGATAGLLRPRINDECRRSARRC